MVTEQATQPISNTEDIIDIRDVMARVEYLADADDVDTDAESEDQQELASLTALLEECRGNGGDEKWRGDWYPLILVRESHFEDYAREYAEEIGAIDPKATWPLQHIDWEAAANQLLMDYSPVDFDGIEYYFR